jgi:peptidoglycan-N-acetylglucosamine deacetylase
MGLQTVLWSIDTQDWRNPGVDAIVNEVLSKVTGLGDVILMHDATGDRSQTIAALEEIIPVLQSWGLQFHALRC